MDDLRVVKTKQALCDAFQDLMEERPFEKITVNALCERAAVRRGTFYNHFFDKYDFFAYYTRVIQQAFIENYKRKEDAAASYFGTLTEELLDFFNQNVKLVHRVVQSSAYPTLLNIVSDTIEQDVKQWIGGHAQTAMDADPADTAAFFTGGIIRLVASRAGHHIDEAEKRQIVAFVCQTAKLLKLTE